MVKNKQITLRDKSELLRLLGHPTRLAIIARLATGPKCVTDIHELLDVPQPNVSQHLMALRTLRIVDFYEKGKLRCYYIARPGLGRLVLAFLDGDFPIVKRSRSSVHRAGLRRKRTEACKPNTDQKGIRRSRAH